MEKKRETKLGKFLAYILRHKPESIGLTLDENGWADIKTICKNTEEPIKYSEILSIVENDNKGRYALSAHNSKIRANQGHSVKVDVELGDYTPTDVLYHGTARRNVREIMKKGLIPGSRLHVHLSTDTDTAVTVGKRHGDPVVLSVDTQAMLRDGFKFYESLNKVILVFHVPAKYLTPLTIEA